MKKQTNSTEKKKSTSQNLYDAAGWLDWLKISEDYPQPFLFCIGARGIGKSYGLIKYLAEQKTSFLYLRRTETESSLQASETTSQISPILNDSGIAYKIRKESGGKLTVYECDGFRIMCAALSTFHNLRGFDGSSIRVIVFDEFIPEMHTRRMKGEGIALSNLYETINRNRELNGDEPVRLYALANSMNIAADVMRTFGLITWAEAIKNDPERETASDDIKALIIPKHSRISLKKADTALYRATSEEFGRMAIENQFFQNDFSIVSKQKNLQAWRPVVQIGSLYVYRHKSEAKWYVTTTPAKCRRVYEDTITDRQKLDREEGDLYVRYLCGKVIFENYNCVALFEAYYGA